jgi:hypothetical protein
MRTFMLAILAALIALGSTGCTDYFQGTQLVFEFDNLPVLKKIRPEDQYAATTGTGELCADDTYVSQHLGQADQFNNLYEQPYEYHAWATINGGPVRLARFMVRHCTVNSADTEIKPAVTTISYNREPAYLSADDKHGSQFFGSCNYVSAPILIGAATIYTEVRVDQATEFFLTREEVPEGQTEVNLANGPQGTLLMLGNVVHENAVYTATLDKISGNATGMLTAIPADRSSAW